MDTLLLDLDGVLIPSADLHAVALEAAVHELGQHAVVAAGQRTAVVASERGLLSVDLEARKDWWVYHLAHRWVAMNHGETARVTQQLIEEVRRHDFHKVAIVTSTPDPAAMMLVEAFFGNLADVALEWPLYSRESHEQKKPAPDTYLRAIAALEVNPADCIAIEDEERGAEAAAGARIGQIIRVRDGWDAIRELCEMRLP